MQQLPIGISEFSELRRKNCVYVDKTRFIYSLLKTNTKTFLSRPRRFGKSLFLSTLESALQGTKELFKGLWIESSDYAWDPYGVIRLDFSELAANSVEDFKEKFVLILLKCAEQNNIVLEKTNNVDALFMQLIAKMYNVSLEIKRPLALLIDEYDSPILYALHNPELAKAFRDIIKSFALIAKANQKQIEFVFVTGVSAFSKSGLSSGLNNLKNLTMNEEFFAVCGYTDAEIDFYFKEHMEAWANLREIPYDELRENLKTWYNGYCFLEKTFTVYSPFSFTCALDVKRLQNFWFESATPQFLLDELIRAERQQECNFLHLDELEGSIDLLQTFEIECIPLAALLFQMGYLTIRDYNTQTRFYSLKYPNAEVKTALHRHLVSALTKTSLSSLNSIMSKLFSALIEENIEQLVACLKSIFSNLPYQLHSKDEQFYHAILQALFIASGIKAQAEYSTSQGRADITLDLQKIIYVIEVKVNEAPEEGLKQIESQKYYEPFLHLGKSIQAIGLSFIRKKASKKNKSHFSIEYVTKKLK